jgi:uncharacterized membrane protein HdeD (DUF308 family)
MPLLIDDIKQLAQETKAVRQGGLPPFFSFVVTAVSMIIGFLAAFFFVFPFLRSVFSMSMIGALFIALGVFVIVSTFLSEIVTVLLQSGQSKEA